VTLVTQRQLRQARAQLGERGSQVQLLQYGLWPVGLGLADDAGRLPGLPRHASRRDLADATPATAPRSPG
jgi:hypothetical protein